MQGKNSSVIKKTGKSQTGALQSNVALIQRHQAYEMVTTRGWIKTATTNKTVLKTIVTCCQGPSMAYRTICKTNSLKFRLEMYAPFRNPPPYPPPLSMGL